MRLRSCDDVRLLHSPMLRDHAVHRPHGVPRRLRDLPPRLFVLVTGDDDSPLVVVHDARAAADLAVLPRGLPSVPGLAADLAAAVLGESKSRVEEKGPLGVFARCDALRCPDRTGWSARAVLAGGSYRAGHLPHG